MGREPRKKVSGTGTGHWQRKGGKRERNAKPLFLTFINTLGQFHKQEPRMLNDLYLASSETTTERTSK